MKEYTARCQVEDPKATLELLDIIGAFSPQKRRPVRARGLKAFKWRLLERARPDAARFYTICTHTYNTEHLLEMRGEYAFRSKMPYPSSLSGPCCAAFVSFWIVCSGISLLRADAEDDLPPMPKSGCFVLAAGLTILLAASLIIWIRIRQRAKHDKELEKNYLRLMAINAAIRERAINYRWSTWPSMFKEALPFVLDEEDMAKTWKYFLLQDREEDDKLAKREGQRTPRKLPKIDQV